MVSYELDENRRNCDDERSDVITPHSINTIVSALDDAT